MAAVAPLALGGHRAALAAAEVEGDHDRHDRAAARVLGNAHRARVGRVRRRRRREPRGLHRVRARARAVRLPRAGVRVGAPVRADGDGEGDVPLLADRHPGVRDRRGCGDRAGRRLRARAGSWRCGRARWARGRRGRSGCCSPACTRSCWRERRARSSSSACLRSRSRASASPTTSRSGGKRGSWLRRPKAEWRGGCVRPLR